MIEVKRVKLTRENILKIKAIDDSFYNDEILTLDWYLARYNKNHDGIFLVLDDEVIGYLVSVPIKKELYETITNGVIVNDLYINPQMIVDKSKYNYIVSIVILEKYRNNEYSKVMIEELAKISKGKYCTLTTSKEGYILANKYMKHKIKINDEVSVFVLNN